MDDLTFLLFELVDDLIIGRCKKVWDWGSLDQLIGSCPEVVLDSGLKWLVELGLLGSERFPLGDFHLAHFVQISEGLAGLVFLVDFWPWRDSVILYREVLRYEEIMELTRGGLCPWVRLKTADFFFECFEVVSLESSLFSYWLNVIKIECLLIVMIDQSLKMLWVKDNSSILRSITIDLLCQELKIIAEFGNSIPRHIP